MQEQPAPVLGDQGNKLGQNLKRVYEKLTLANSLLVVSVLLFVAALLWIVFAAIIWPFQNTARFRETLRRNNNTLEVWGPKVVPGDQPVELHITLTEKQFSFHPVKLTLEIPEELRLIEPQHPDTNVPGGPVIRFHRGGKTELVLQFNKTGETQVVRLASAQTGGVFSSQTAITVSNPPPTALPVKVEGTLRTALRRSGG